MYLLFCLTMLGCLYTCGLALGRKVRFCDLPKPVQACIIRDCTGDTDG